VWPLVAPVVGSVAVQLVQALTAHPGVSAVALCAFGTIEPSILGAGEGQ
jgi:hypothetical protein